MIKHYTNSRLLYFTLLYQRNCRESLISEITYLCVEQVNIKFLERPK